MLVDPRTGRPLEGVDHCCATATTITFVNECPTPVGIFWQNASAERTLYMTLQPGVDYTQVCSVLRCMPVGPAALRWV